VDQTVVRLLLADDSTNTENTQTPIHGSSEFRTTSHYSRGRKHFVLQTTGHSDRLLSLINEGIQYLVPVEVTWSGTLFKKLIVALLVKKYYGFYGTGSFITVFTTLCHFTFMYY
jgi:hypothetical protein